MLELNRYVAVAILTLGVWGMGCHNPDDYAFNSDESPSLERFLTLRASGDTALPADGFSAVELIAHVGDVSEGPLQIVFTTTAGSLREGTKVGTRVQIDSVGTTAVRSDSVVVLTNVSGEAMVELVSDTRQTTALVRARVLGVEPIVEQEIKIDFNAVADTELLAFVAAPESAFAHGLALVPFAVQIAPGLQGDERQVRFETTGGTFPFSPDSSRTQSVRANAEGVATAYLRSPEQVGEAQVRASVLSFSQERVIHFVQAPTDSVIRFVEAPETALADGQSLSRFSVEISPLLQRDQDRTVVFLTTLGRFVLPDGDGSTVSVRADANGVATALLRSPNQFDQAFVRASVKGFVQQQMLPFAWAGPDSIVVQTELNRVNLTVGDQVPIEAELIRLAGRGRVTENLEVIFSVADSLGNPLAGGRFVDVTRVDDKGRASATFVVDDSQYEGSASISVRPARIVSQVVGRVQLTILPR